MTKQEESAVDSRNSGNFYRYTKKDSLIVTLLVPWLITVEE